MDRNFFISGYRKAGTFCLVALLYGASCYFAEKIPSAKFPVTDIVLERVEKTHGAKVAVLGDSVVQDFLTRYPQPYRTDFVNLTTHGFYEMTGQYFLLKRYLENNPQTKSVIYIAHNPFGLNLDNEFIQSEFARKFLNWSEIYEVALAAKRMDLTFNMLMYKISPLYRRRSDIAQIFDQFHNINVATTDFFPAAAAESFDYRDSISEKYFVKMHDMLSEKGIRFYYFFPPHVKDMESIRMARIQRPSPFAYFQERMKYYQARWPDFVYEDSLALPRRFIYDEVHMNSKGMKIYFPVFYQQLDRVVAN